VPQSKISVTYLGGSLESIDAGTASAKLPSRYVLLVGTRNGYKNAYFAIRSLARLLEADPNLSLVCAGGGAFKEAENRFFEELGIAGRIQYMPASDANLALLYEKAIAFVFPSLYEGFGIPIIEAFSRGCPVVASNTPALVEVGGDAAQYFDPKRAESLIHALQMIFSDASYREELVKRGYMRAASFSWEKCVAETKTIYRKTIATS
jgi:glycosyltransferase involved in cell wall biosynthesis